MKKILNIIICFAVLFLWCFLTSAIVAILFDGYVNYFVNAISGGLFGYFAMAPLWNRLNRAQKKTPPSEGVSELVQTSTTIRPPWG